MVFRWSLGDSSIVNSLGLFLVFWPILTKFGNEGVFRIPQSFSIIGTSPLDCLVSYLGHSLKRDVLPLCREAVGVFYSSNRLEFG